LHRSVGAVVKQHDECKNHAGQPWAKPGHDMGERW
jgi:hypothetical protein